MQEVSLRGRIFYGWWLLVGLFLIYMASNGILLNTIPRIFPDLRAEFGWTNDQVTLPANMFFALVAFLNPLAGWLSRPLLRSPAHFDRNRGHNPCSRVVSLWCRNWWHLVSLYVLFAVSRFRWLA